MTDKIRANEDMKDERELAESVRAALAGTGNIREVKMFGGIGFMLNGNLAAATSRRGLLLRVGKDGQAEVLAQSGARPMIMRGRTMEGYVYVDSPALNKQAIQKCLRLAVAHVQTLPPKAKAKPKQRKGKRK
jgi:TfoX/Sxy family transcriptional regulator of competence genes